MKLKQKFLSLMDKLFVADYKCIICGSEIVKDSRYSVCPSCMKSLPFINSTCELCGCEVVGSNICLNCKHTKPKVVRNLSVFNYTAPISGLIYSLKYGNAKYLAPYLSTFMLDKFIESGISVDMLIPVAMSKERLKQRGYNQATLLCSAFEKYLHLPVEDNVVERVINTPNQTTLTRDLRLTNLVNAFKVVDKSKVKDKTILIVDDVYTTGTTVGEIAKVLYKAKAKAVYSITLAHSVYKIEMEEVNKNKDRK